MTITREYIETLIRKGKPICITNETIYDKDLSGLDLSNATFIDTKFIKVSLINTIMENTNLIDTEFKECNLTNATLKHTLFKDCICEDSKFIKTNFFICKANKLYIQKL